MIWFWINDSYWYGFSIWRRILKNTFWFFFPRDGTHFLMRLQLSTSDLKCCLSIFLFDSLGPSCRSSHNAWMVFKSGLIGLQICPWDLLVPGHVWEANQLIKVKQIEMWGDNWEEIFICMFFSCSHLSISCNLKV